MRKLLTVLLVGILAVSMLTGCGGAKYKDGTYEAQSTADKYGNYGEAKITIKDGKITDAQWKEYTGEGKEKDETYGQGDETNYEKAQVALEASKTYGQKLVDEQDLKKVDAVSGATSSHTSFKEAAEKALEKAK